MQSRVPLKGKPLSNLSDVKLKQYINMVQDFIYCFRGNDKEKEQVLQEIWKLLTIEEAERTSREFDNAIDNNFTDIDKKPKLQKRKLVKLKIRG